MSAAQTDSVDVEELGRELEGAATSLPPLDHTNEIRLMAAREDGHARTFALKLVGWVYASALGLMAILILREAFVGSATTAFGYLNDAMKVLVIPVLTLVLGHYIGRNSR